MRVLRLASLTPVLTCGPALLAVEPVDPDVIPEARKLLDYVVSVQGKGILSGISRYGDGESPCCTGGLWARAPRQPYLTDRRRRRSEHV